MAYLTLIAQLEAKNGRENKLEQVLQALVVPTMAEPGCMNYDLYRDNENPRKFALHENWQNESLWQKHMKSAHMTKFQSVTDELVANWTLQQLTRISSWRRVSS
ncbi:MAG: antibiotic biosynthesis monooxygenase [Chitinophagales bacterium]|nr:antibiotic biosynthesis monooxygenase [Hyphomicrobiales bacterium]